MTYSLTQTPRSRRYKQQWKINTVKGDILVSVRNYRQLIYENFSRDKAAYR